MEYPQHIWLLLARQVSGEASDQDLAELAVLRGQYPDLDAIAEQLAHFWQMPPVHPGAASKEEYEKFRDKYLPG